MFSAVEHIPGYFCLGSCRGKLTGEDVVVSVLATVLRQQSRVLGLVSAHIFKFLTATNVDIETELSVASFHGDKCAYGRDLQ